MLAPVLVMAGVGASMLWLTDYLSGGWLQGGSWQLSLRHGVLCQAYVFNTWYGRDSL